MAEVNRDPFVDSPYTLRQIIESAYRSSFNNRFKNFKKDVKNRVRVEDVIIWKVNYSKGAPENVKVHTYRIKVTSIDPEDNVHTYPVVINCDYLSLDAKTKIRCGSERTYTDKESMNEKRICGDFFFRFQKVYKDLGILFGRDSTNHRPPMVTNPNQELGCCKHIWGALVLLTKSGFLREGFDPEGDKRYIEMFK